MKLATLPWKYVISFNLSLLILGGAFMMSKVTQNNTDNRSNASSNFNTPPSPVPTLKADNPSTRSANLNPKFDSIEPDWAKVGDQVIIHGQDFGKSPFGSLKIGNVYIPTQNIIDWSDQTIVFEVPKDTITAPITLEYKTPDNRVESITTTKNLEIRSQNKLN